MSTFKRYFETSPAPDMSIAISDTVRLTPRELAAMEAAGEITTEIQEFMQPLLERCDEPANVEEDTLAA